MIYLYASLIFIGYHIVNIPLAYWNVEIVIDRIINGNKKQIEHFWWGLGYALICIPQYFLFGGWFLFAILIPHLTIFAPAYNYYRGFPLFNLSKTSSSLTDRILVKAGFKDIEGPVLLAEFMAIVFFTISLYQL